MERRIIRLLKRKKFKKILIICVKIKNADKILEDCVKKIKNNELISINNSYINFMNDDNNIFKNNDRKTYGLDTLEIRDTLANLYKVQLGAIILKNII